MKGDAMKRVWTVFDVAALALIMACVVFTLVSVHAI